MHDMARWVQDIKLSDPDTLYTIVAGWWPTTFWSVMTWERKVASAAEGIALLNRQLCEAFPEKCGPARDYYISEPDFEKSPT